MVESLIKVLETGLSLWNTKESRRYKKKVLELKKDWYEEFNKPISSDAVLDNIGLQLRLISDSFSSEAGVKDTTTE